MERNRPTLRDVAKLAGVSVSTASGVFTTKVAVSEQTRAAVLAAAGELGYQPRQRRATRQATDGITSIALISEVPPTAEPFRPHHSLFFGPILHAAELTCSTLGISLVFERLHHRTPGARDPLPLAVQQGQAQGLLLLAHMNPAYLERIVSTGIPCVLVHNFVEDLPVDSVTSNDFRAGYLATRHLLELGHTDPIPAIIAGPQHISVLVNHLAGYRHALLEWGLTPNPAYIRTARGANAPHGRTEMAALLGLPTPPTAVACCNDHIAQVALGVLAERGVDVPRECSVIGYGDLQFAASTTPPLTTISEEQELMGKQGVWHLLERIRHPDMGVRETRLPVHLIERDSTAKPQ